MYLLIVTLLAVTCVLILLVSETYYFFGNQRMDTIIVDHSDAVPFPIYMDVIFPFLDCSNVMVDLVDDFEHSIPVFAHDIRKLRINMQGADLSQAQQRAAVENAAAAAKGEEGGPQTPVMTTAKDLGKGLGAVSSDCMPCSERGFSWMSSEKCCNCAEVENYFRSRDDTTSYTSHPLCIREHSTKLRQSLSGTGSQYSLSQVEGCRVKGSVIVPRTRANLHIAANLNQVGPAKFGSKPALDALNNNFKVQHVVRELIFGYEFDGQATPLAGVELYEPGLLRHIYLIKLVPTRYEGGWIPVDSYQYSYSPHTEKIDTKKAHWHLPGVYFRYDFTPMMALISTRYSHFSTYITRVFALVGGLWVVLGVIYRMSNKVVAQVNTKKNQ